MNKVITIAILLASMISKSFSQDTLGLKTYVGNLKQLTIPIEGKTYQFLFDTGGGETFISPAICSKSSLDKVTLVIHATINRWIIDPIILQVLSGDWSAV